ncbi:MULTISPECIES: CpsD/CapB family tyrosine-protein kinase [Anaerococcus]|uniref:non-specific protein-tyrosine kinase n=1 Tax=Anaerococcus vaginalis TaxID=33037 RepID=A0A6N2T6R0_9FIRM|nr:MULTISPECIES: CpsD/CapB family tyrosine-protein kinase [Anaerococcus]MDU7687363.1 CpsD/CapB family tyrosine-protein kinase [Bacillota bacterium]MBS4890035.1 CpsD/CapB family tyrosine-protein kinase [Anaerococcus vaginalis]MDU1707630.1 CpsD/CapB family tyrosine-protein kinase [Anaerococcus vaginalis]MDU1763307.1 CpsD/CapB family tyrosine-protein kinase [Anaerococcus vaginalis]MDU2649325.1 CpsD/CapB family tyrosine-protein kinase [Anaerococcus vaginalis]
MFNKNKANKIEKSFESLKNNFLKIADKNSLVQFVSSNEKINKSSLILNLARALAKDNYKVIIIEADFRNPMMGDLCDIEFDRGFFDILEKEKPYENFIVKDHFQKNLDLILAPDQREINPSILNYDRIENIFDSLKEKYNFIFLDTADNEKYDDANFYPRLADSVIVFARKKDFRRKKLNASIRKLENVNAQISGIITTDN